MVKCFDLLKIYLGNSRKISECFNRFPQMFFRVGIGLSW